MSLTDDVKPGEARCPGHPTTKELIKGDKGCLLYTSPSPRD